MESEVFKNLIDILITTVIVLSTFWVSDNLLRHWEPSSIAAVGIIVGVVVMGIVMYHDGWCPQK